MRNTVALSILGVLLLLFALVAYINAKPDVPLPGDPTGDSHGCKPLVRAAGSAATLEPMARIYAHKAWKREVKAAYGHRFTWAGARERSVECERVGFKHVCTASARPCS